MNILSERFNSTPFKEFDLDYLKQAADFWNSANYLNIKEMEIFFSSELKFDRNELISFLNGFLFSNEFIYHIATFRKEDGVAIFSESFLNYLQRFQCSMEIDLTANNTNDSISNYCLRLKTKEIDLYILRFLLQILCFKRKKY